MDDSLPFEGIDENVARREAAVCRTPALVARRQLVNELLDIRPGEALCSIGCGPGFEPAALANATGENGRVHAIDHNAGMLAETERRCGDRPHVTVAQNDATALAVADETFDAATAVHVYAYVNALETAVAELCRVLRPGGRAVVCDADFDSFVWRSIDNDRTERVLSAWHDHRPRPHLGSRLASHLTDAGLTVEEVRPYTICNRRFDSETFVYHLAQFIASFVANSDAIGIEEARRWCDDLRRTEEKGRTFFSYTDYCYIIHKPE